MVVFSLIESETSSKSFGEKDLDTTKTEGDDPDIPG